MDKHKKENLNSNFIKKYPLIFKKYRPIRKIASGVFSEIYGGINILNNEKVAIKIEKRNIKNKYLESECYTLFSLRNIGIPQVLSFGHNKEYDILVMPLLGKSLLDLFISKNSNYEFKDICLIAIQIIERIQWVHSRKFIHRDIKPDNFLIGLNDPHIIYLIDFGLSKKYQSTKSGKHILYSESKKFTGTITYGSVNSLKCREQSRRDDLESIGYMLIYFMKGRLPWQSVKVDNKKESYLRVSQMKKSILPEELCENLPGEFTDYMKYVKNLKFEENPNYGYLRNLFVQLMKKQGFEEGTCFFSWVNINNININNIKRQMNLSKRSSSRKRVINKIKKTLENSHKSYSEVKHDSFFLMKDICDNNNENINENDNDNNNNKFNINTKIKKFVDKKYINQALLNNIPNVDDTNTLEVIRKEGSIENDFKSTRNNNNRNNNIVSINNNIIKNNNKNTITPYSRYQDNFKNYNNMMTDNTYNITNTIYTQKNFHNNYIKLNSNNNKINLISSYNNNHKRISSNNVPNQQKRNNINKRALNNNSNSFIYKKKNIIIINNNIYQNNPNNQRNQKNSNTIYNNTINNDRNKKLFISQKVNPNYNNIKVNRDRNVNNKNLKSIKLFNIFSPKKKVPNISYQANNINNNKRINNDLIRELKMFNQRYNNNQQYFEKSRIDNENFFKKIIFPKNIHTIKSSDNKKGLLNNTVNKSKFHSPRNDNCIIL